MAYKSATNPKTGETFVLMGNEWQTVKTATNPQTGETFGLVGTKWEPLGVIDYFKNLYAPKGVGAPLEGPPAGLPAMLQMPQQQKAPVAPGMIPTSEGIQAAEEVAGKGAVAPEFTAGLEAYLSSLPEAKRAEELNMLLAQPEASPYSRAARVVAEKFKQYDVSSRLSTLEAYDPRLEAQTKRFIDAGMRAEDAQALAQQQARSGAFFKAPDVAQPDLVRMEARQYGESLKDAGFLRRVGEEAKSQYTQAGLGMIQFVGDLSGQGRLTRRALQAGREQDALQAAIPKGESQFEQSAQQALASLAVQGPTIAAGIMTGTSAPVIAQTLLQSFGTEYGQGRRANLDPAEAATRAALISSAEGFFERYGLESQFKTLRKSLGKIPTNNLSGVLAKSIATELPAEAATTTAQFLIDKAPEIGLAPNAGMKEFLEAQAETLRQTLIQSNATVAGVYGAGKVAEAFTPESAKAEYRAEQAKQRALGEWEKFGAQFRESAEKAKQRKAAERPEPKLEVGAKGTVGPAYETVEQQQRFDAIVRQHIQYGVPEKDAIAMAKAELEEETAAKEALIEGRSYPSDEIPLVPTPLTRFTTEERAEPKLGELAPMGEQPPTETKDGAYEKYMRKQNRINATAQELLDSGYTYSTEEAYRLAKQRIDEIEALEEEDAAQAQVTGEPVSVGVGVGPTVSEPTAVPPAAETAPKPKRSRVARTRKTISDLVGAEGEPSAALTEAPVEAPTAAAPTAEAPVAEAPTPTPATPTPAAPAEAPTAPAEAPVVQAPTPVPGEQSVNKTPDQIKEELKVSAPKTADKIKLQDNDPTIEASAVFAPPAEPTLLNRRNAKDIPATERIKGLPISGGTSEGDIVDPKKRQAKFDEVNYTESKPAMTQDLAGAIESTYPAQTLGNIGVIDYGMTTWLGAHFNGGLFITTSHSKGLKENAPVVGHELGHAAHSLLGDKINKNPRVLEEFRAVEDFLYPGLRDKIAAAEGNYDNKFFNYLLSPDELIAEFNVQRLGNPEQARKVAPILTRLLQSVDNNPGLVKKRKTVPSGLFTVLPANGYFAVDGMHSMDINTYPPSEQARYYIRGEEKTKTTKNLKKAIQLLESVEDLHAFALMDLADLYEGKYGDEVKNLAKAAEVYDRLAERALPSSQETNRKKAEALREQAKQKKKEPKYTPAKGVRFVGSGDYFDVEINGKMTPVQVGKSLSIYQQYQMVYRKPTGQHVTELFTSLNDAKRRAEEIAKQLVAEQVQVGALVNDQIDGIFDLPLREGMAVVYRQKPSDATSVNEIIEAIDHTISTEETYLIDALDAYKLQDYTDYAGDAYVSRANKVLADLNVRDVLQMWAEVTEVTVPEVPAGVTFKDYGINTLGELKAQRGKAIADVFGAEPKKESKAGRKAATEEERAEAKKARATTSTAYKRAERKLNKAIKFLTSEDAEDPFERAKAVAQLYAIAKAWKGGSADGVGARAAARLAEPDITDKDRAQAKKDYEAKRDAGEEPRGIEFLSIRDVRGFYSALERAVANAKQEVAPASDWIAIIDKLPGVKKDEIEWSGIREYLQLKGKEKITRDALVDYLERNGVEVKEVLHEDANDMNREQLLAALDFEYPFASAYHANMSDDQLRLAYHDSRMRPKYKKTFLVLPGGKKNYKELLLGLDRGFLDNEETYTNDHWEKYSEDLDVLAHVRFNERTDSDGNRILFIEEIQSDWAQAGRGVAGIGSQFKLSKEQQIAAQKLIENLEKEEEALSAATHSLRMDITHESNLDKQIKLRDELYEVSTKLSTVSHTLSVVKDTVRNSSYGVDRGPFVTDTKAWVALTIKRMIRYAIDNGFDKVAFINGEQSADRYGLTKYISQVEFSDNSSGGVGRAQMTGEPSAGVLTVYDLDGNRIITQFMEPNKVADYIGKELAEKLFATTPVEKYSQGINSRNRLLEGLSLKTGGKGMRDFYDKIVPQVANEVLGKLGGGKVKPTDINIGGELLSQLSFDITDKMRDKVAEGLPLFAPSKDMPSFIVSPPIMDDLTLAQSDVRRLEREYQQGRLTEEEFADRIQQAREAVQAARKTKYRARGAANFRAELRKAVQNGELTPKEVMLAEWFIQQNPALLDDLGVALEPSGERTPAGQYLDAKQVVLLFKRGTVRTTIVHEILHHLERMLPEKLQAAITKEWMKQFLRARKEAKTPALKEYFEAVYNYNFGDHKTKEARQAAAQEAINVIEENKLDANSLYQYFNPSEFWATNGSDIVAGRYDAIQGGLLQRLKNWLRELAQKLKSTFGMESHGDIIRALDSLAKADGKFQSSKMLARRLSPTEEGGGEYKAIGRRTPAELDADFQRAEQIVTSSETGNDLREGLELLAALKNPSAIAPEIRYGWDALSDGGRRGLTKVLTTDLLAEVNKEDIPELSNTVKLFQAMNGESKELMTAGADLLQSIMRLLGNDPQRIRNYAKAIYKFTISEYDPADPNNAYRHTQMDAMYAALGPKGQQAYNLHKNYYVTMAAQRAQLTQQQISLLPATSQSKQALRLKLKKLYEDGQKITPYFPLHRFGQFWIATGSGPRRQFFTYDSMQQRDRAFEQMAKRMYPNKPLREAREEALNSKRLRMGNSDDFYTDRTLLAEASAMLPEIFSIIDAANFTTTGPNANRANANLKEELKDAFYQLYLETMPEADVRKQFIHREGVPGFSLDVVRSIAKSVMQNSMQLPKLKYAQRLRNSVSQARDSIAERPHLTPYVQEMERRADSALAPPNTGIGMQVAGAANRVAFVFYLSSASSALIQPMSLLITGAPVLWARHGVAATTAELTRLLQFWKTLGVTKKNLDGTVSWEAPSLAYAKGLTPMQQRAVKELSARGLFQSTTAADLYGRPDQPSEEYGSKWEKTKDYTNMVFVGLIQSTERLTREYMALAAFNLSMRKASKAALQALPPNATATQRQAALDMAFEQAIDEAMLDTNEALMDPAPYNRPLGMQSALGRVLLLFKTFPLHVISYLGLNAVQIIRASNGAAKKEAAYKFFGTMGMLLTFTGLAGSPFIMPAITALAAMFQALGEDDDEMPDEFRDMNFEAWLRSVYLPTAFGKVEIGGYNLEGWADVVDRGLANKLTGWDFASRLGLSDVLYRDPSPTGSTKGDVTNLIIALGGPVPALALRWADAWDAYSVGDYQRAWELSTPALIRNPLVAKRYEEEGVITPTGETIIAQGGLKTSELVGQVIGFAPDIISNTQRLAFEMNKAEKQINIERKKLTKRLEVAIRKEDDELFDAVADDIHKFTLRNPALGVDFDTFIDSVYKKRENLVGSEAGFTITDKNYAWAQDAILRNALRIAAREREMIEEAQKRLQKALQGNPPDMVIRKGQ